MREILARATRTCSATRAAVDKGPMPNLQHRRSSPDRVLSTVRYMSALPHFVVAHTQRHTTWRFRMEGQAAMTPSIWGKCKDVQIALHNHVRCTCPECNAYKRKREWYRCVLTDMWHQAKTIQRGGSIEEVPYE